MTKFALLLAAAGFVAFAPAVVKAAETHTTTHTTTTSTAAVEKERTDGTKVSVEGDMAYVVAADGTKTPAPDGEHEFKDGTKATTKDGKIVK